MSLLNTNKRTKTSIMESNELPEVIIQHIQSFLNDKDGLRSSILSKQWHNAWFTRPNLHLNEKHFMGIRTTSPQQDFQVYATRTLERYRKSNLNLESFKLRMLTTDLNGELADQLIIDALKLGVNHLDVCVFSNKYTLPREVFTYKSLEKLSLQGRRVSFPTFYHTSDIVRLELANNVTIQDDVMTCVLLGCPLIENLDLRDCIGLKTVNLSVARRTLRHFSACCSSNHSPSMENHSLRVQFEENDHDQGYEYSKLISLVLDNVTATGLFLDTSDDSSSQHDRFPCLETIVFYECKSLYSRCWDDRPISFNKVMKSLTTANIQIEDTSV